MEIPAQLCHFYVGNMMFSTAGFWGIISIWVHYNDLTVLPHWNHVYFYREMIPKWPFFRLVIFLEFTQKYPIFRQSHFCCCWSVQPSMFVRMAYFSHHSLVATAHHIPPFPPLIWVTAYITRLSPVLRKMNRIGVGIQGTPCMAAAQNMFGPDPYPGQAIHTPDPYPFEIEFIWDHLRDSFVTSFYHRSRRSIRFLSHFIS